MIPNPIGRSSMRMQGRPNIMGFEGEMNRIAPKGISILISRTRVFEFLKPQLGLGWQAGLISAFVEPDLARPD